MQGRAVTEGYIQKQVVIITGSNRISQVVIITGGYIRTRGVMVTGRSDSSDRSHTYGIYVYR